MSADLLREAAALMRARAEAATPGPWGYVSKWTTATTALTRITKKGATVAEVRDGGDGIMTLHHLSYWHPAVALAVADWLDNVSEHAERYNDGLTRDALAVARAYLGRPS